MGLPPRGRLSVQMTGLQMFLAKVSSNGLGWRDFLSSLFISFVKNRHRQLVNHSTCGHGCRRSHRSHRHPGWLRRGRGVPEDHGACHGPGGLVVALAAAGADVAAGMPKLSWCENLFGRLKI